MIKPLGVHVLIETISKQDNFIIKPEGAKGAPEEGIVLAIGAGVESDELQEGVKVYFRRYSAEPFEIDGKELHLPDDRDWETQFLLLVRL